MFKKTALLTAAIAGLCLAHQAAADLIWNVSEAGGNVTMTTSGSLDLGSITGTSETTIQDNLSAPGINWPGNSGWHHVINTAGDSSWYRSGDLNGVATNSAPFSAVTTGFFAPTSVSGDVFGHQEHGNGHVKVYWDKDTNSATPGTLTPVSTMVFNSQTIAGMFGTSLDSGPVLLWTAPSGDTISIGLVPEPSSLALLGLGGLLIARRRRG